MKRATAIPTMQPNSPADTTTLSMAGLQSKGPSSNRSSWLTLSLDMHVPGKSTFNVVFFKFSGFSINVWLTIPPRAKIILYCSIVALKMHKKGISPATKNLSLGFKQNVFKPFKFISCN